MSNGKVTNEEYEHICETKKCDTEIRNNLLTFTFTAVITFMGFIFASDKELHPIIYLLPYVVLIPFTGRMSYYRRWSAHMNTFLDVYAPQMRLYTEFCDKVKIETNWMDKILAWFVNYELGVLAVAVMVLFYVKYLKNVCGFSWADWFWMVIPAVCTMIVFALLKSVRDYDRMQQKYVEEWDKWERVKQMEDNEE